ncbi:MAG: DNA repair protein RadA [Ilumatobacteraceae bacterium]|nr:DNA repair protein RadA [Ilumatobacteraceae bacterium]
MARLRTVYICSDCGAQHPKWNGQCATCGAWNTLVEDVVGSDTPLVSKTVAVNRSLNATSEPLPIMNVAHSAAAATPTGIGELDRVLDGGLVPGSVTLVSGEPGIGKSTLLLQMVGAWSQNSLYVSAEESAQQVRLRAERIGIAGDHTYLVSAMSLGDIVAAIDKVKPSLVVVDSVQTIADESVESAPGSVTQVRECAFRLVQEAKARNVAVVLVGHVTKDGNIAGPRLLEHVVDTVVSFEGDRLHPLRMVRAIKHRFGTTNELGLFEMTDRGLVGVPDASNMLLADRQQGVAGSVVVPTIDGQRPLLVEVQALTTKVATGITPRRSAQGVESSRLAMLLAVLERRAKIPFASLEVYASVVGGVRLNDPGSDLALCLALASAAMDKPVHSDMVALGEVGLGGEIRHVTHLERRVIEAERMGFRRVLIPSSSKAPELRRATLVRASTLSDALSLAL